MNGNKAKREKITIVKADCTSSMALSEFIIRQLRKQVWNRIKYEASNSSM